MNENSLAAFNPIERIKKMVSSPIFFTVLSTDSSCWHGRLLRPFSDEKRPSSLAIEGCVFLRIIIRKDDGLKLSSAK